MGRCCNFDATEFVADVVADYYENMEILEKIKRVFSEQNLMMKMMLNNFKRF